MPTILRFIVFFLLAPVFAIVAQALGSAQDDFRIEDTNFRTESIILENVDSEICNYDSSGALLQQRRSIDDDDSRNGYQDLEISGAAQPLLPFLAELVATNNVTRTVANTTRGWKVGDPINNLTRAGNVPKWNSVRQRYWKNEALNSGSNYSPANAERMRRGLAPQRINPNTGKIESMELHHTPAQRDGGLFDVQKVWPNDHAAIDPFRNTGG